ncbi:MAG TPA: NAD(P)/FAD-dependent oxidoreductase [Bacteroidales bacterium]|nr:NAD(P)/FAD-dependent oxidoreductase [Bacteroidales bacterium]
MPKTIAIIGAGMAGLSAGIYARLNGFDTEIFEMHDKAGGLCTSWKRKGYIFDGCVHWLTGSSPRSSYYKLWEEIGCVQGKEFFPFDYFTKITDAKGRLITFYTDPDTLEQELLTHYPADRKFIRSVARTIRKLMKTEIPVDMNAGVLKDLPAIIYHFFKFRKSPQQIAQKIHDPDFREVFVKAFEWHGMSLVFNLWAMSLMAARNGAYPMGGSTGLIRSVTDRYEKLGGKIRYRARVKKILTGNGKATGILLESGEEVRSDIVISAADGYTTIYNWLEGKYTNKRINGLYANMKPFPPLVLVSLGVAADYSGVPYTMTFTPEKKIDIAGETIDRMSYRNYYFDRSLAPAGKSTFLVMHETKYEYWAELYKDPKAYEAEKERVGKEITAALGELYPELPGQVEVMDVATPMTFVRYTGNWRGSYEGWLLTSKTMTVQLPQALPGLADFYMAGHWISPGGGLPSGLITGRKAIRMICRKEKQRFTGS